MSWTRTAPLSPTRQGWTREQWTRTAGNGTPATYPVDVRRGKPFDVVGLKGTDLGGIRTYAEVLAATARRLYDGTGERVAACPACAAPRPAASAEPAGGQVEVLGVRYARCGRCGHAYVGQRPAEERLDELFRDSEEHAATYTDAHAAEQRITEIVAPKIDWVLDVWHRTGRSGAPESAIDVGAGGGHFVEGLRRRGVHAQGFELSAAARAFAQATFGLTLSQEDVRAAAAGPVDLVTLWGLLEYTAQPAPFVAAARRLLDDGGMLVVEVPRFECLSSAVQGTDRAVVARHLDPTSHVNCFTDASLATLLVDGGFVPVAAWYFGMDAYELLVQAALRLSDPSLLPRMADWIPRLQAAADAGSLCDDLVVAAVKQP